MATAACSSTAGDLVFEGTTKQTFAAFRATDGEILWEMPVQTAPVGGAITYEVDGEQYVAVNAGWGGGAAQIERGSGTAMHRGLGTAAGVQARRPARIAAAAARGAHS